MTSEPTATNKDSISFQAMLDDTGSVNTVLKVFSLFRVHVDNDIMKRYHCNHFMLSGGILTRLA